MRLHNLDSSHKEKVVPGGHPLAHIPPIIAGSSHGTVTLARLRTSASPQGSGWESALFLVNFEVQNDVLAAVEAGDRARS